MLVLLLQLLLPEMRMPVRLLLIIILLLLAQLMPLELILVMLWELFRSLRLAMLKGSLNWCFWFSLFNN